MTEAEVERIVVRLVGDPKQFVDAMEKAARKAEETQRSVSGLEAQLSGFLARMSSAAMAMGPWALALGGLGGAFETFKKSIVMTAQAETIRTDFGVMLESMERGKLLVKDLQQFAAATPLNAPDIQRATKTLLQFGTGAGDVLPLLKQLGDVTGGNAQRFNQMALAFGQMSATGRLMGQDLLQMINAGFNPLKEISRTSGKSMADLKDEMEKGGITVDMVKESFKTATSEGGQFFNLMEEQSKTLEGLFSTMQDDVGAMLREFGATAAEGLDLKGVLMGVSQGAKYLGQAFQDASVYAKGLWSVISTGAGNQLPTVLSLLIQLGKLKGPLAPGVSLAEEFGDEVAKSVGAVESVGGRRIAAVMGEEDEKFRRLAAKDALEATQKEVKQYEAGLKDARAELDRLDTAENRLGNNPALRDARREVYRYEQMLQAGTKEMDRLTALAKDPAQNHQIEKTLKHLTEENAMLGMNATQKTIYQAQQAKATAAQLKEVEGAAQLLEMNKAIYEAKKQTNELIRDATAEEDAEWLGLGKHVKRVFDMMKRNPLGDYKDALRFAREADERDRNRQLAKEAEKFQEQFDPTAKFAEKLREVGRLKNFLPEGVFKDAQDAAARDFGALAERLVKEAVKPREKAHEVLAALDKQFRAGTLPAELYRKALAGIANDLNEVAKRGMDAQEAVGKFDAASALSVEGWARAEEFAFNVQRTDRGIGKAELERLANPRLTDKEKEETNTLLQKIRDVLLGISKKPGAGNANLNNP